MDTYPNNPEPNDVANVIARAASLILDPQRRLRVIAELCEGDEQLRDEVESLVDRYMVTRYDTEPRHRGNLFGKTTRQEESEAESSDAVAEVSDVSGYRLIERIGKGGMGTVYMAVHKGSRHRVVALKLLNEQCLSDATVARFTAEFNTLRKLDHPFIVDYLDSGVHPDGRPYYVMELVRGSRLSDFLRRGKISFQERLLLFCKICEAVEHAHRHGVIHRDLKPSNILVTRSGGTLQPKIIDFGIAKILSKDIDSDADCTGFHQIVGTLPYMSPEQVDVSFGGVDTRTDVYALGCILYEMLCGEPPVAVQTFRKATPAQLISLIINTPLSPLWQRVERMYSRRGQALLADDLDLTWRAFRKIIRHDMGWVAARALEKDKSLRYQSVTELRNDVRAFLECRPLSVRPPSWWYVIRKFAQRNRLATSLAGALSVAILAGIGATLFFADHAIRSRELAEKSAARATNAFLEAQRARMLEHQQALRAQKFLYDADMELASHALAIGDLTNCASLLEKYVPAPGEPDFRDFAWYYMYRQVDVKPKWKIDFPDSPVYVMAIEPQTGYVCALVAEYMLVVVDPATGRIISRRALPSCSNAIAFSSTGQMAMATCDGNVQIWETSTVINNTPDNLTPTTQQSVPLGEPDTTINVDIGQIYGLDFSPDGQTLFTGSERGLVKGWEVASGEVKFVVPRLDRTVNELDVSPNGAWVTVASDDDYLHVWDIALQQEKRAWRWPSNFHVSVCLFSPAGRYLVAGNIYGDLKCIDSGSGLGTNATVMDGIESLAFSDESQFLTGDRGGAIRSWRISHNDDNGKPELNPDEQLAWQADPGRIESLVYVDPGQVVSGSRTGTIACWDIAPRASYTEYPRATAMVMGRGNELCLGSNAIYVFELNSGVLARQFGESSANYTRLALAANAPILVATNGENISVFDYHTGHQLATWDEPREVYALAVSADGQWVGFADNDERVEVTVTRWTDGKTARFPARQCNHLAFSKNSDLFAYNDRNDIVIVDWQTQEKIATLVGHTNTVSSFDFAPDGNSIATGSHDRRLKIWEPRTGQLKYSIEAHRRAVKIVKYSPDGDFLLTTGSGLHETRLKLWSVSSKHAVLSFVLDNSCQQIGFNADANHLVVMIAPGIVRDYRAH